MLSENCESSSEVRDLKYWNQNLSLLKKPALLQSTLVGHASGFGEVDETPLQDHSLWRMKRASLLFPATQAATTSVHQPTRY